jgi:hypothetical protein
MVLAGCSNKNVCPKYPLLVKKSKPPTLHLKFIRSKGKDAYIKSLEENMQKMVVKIRQQNKIIEAYEKEYDMINKITKEVK